jgi:hypothetical protein
LIKLSLQYHKAIVPEFEIIDAALFKAQLTTSHHHLVQDLRSRIEDFSVPRSDRFISRRK